MTKHREMIDCLIEKIKEAFPNSHKLLCRCFDMSDLRLWQKIALVVFVFLYIFPFLATVFLFWIGYSFREAYYGIKEGLGDLKKNITDVKVARRSCR